MALDACRIMRCGRQDFHFVYKLFSVASLARAECALARYLRKLIVLYFCDFRRRIVDAILTIAIEYCLLLSIGISDYKYVLSRLIHTLWQTV